MDTMEEVESPLEYAWGVVGHLMGVANSDDLRAAHGVIQPTIVKVIFLNYHVHRRFIIQRAHEHTRRGN